MSNKALTEKASRTGIGRFLRCKPFQEGKTLRAKSLFGPNTPLPVNCRAKILADVIEALIGAVFLSGGPSEGLKSAVVLMTALGILPKQSCVWCALSGEEQSQDNVCLQATDAIDETDKIVGAGEQPESLSRGRGSRYEARKKYMGGNDAGKLMRLAVNRAGRPFIPKGYPEHLARLALGPEQWAKEKERGREKMKLAKRVGGEGNRVEKGKEGLEEDREEDRREFSANEEVEIGKEATLTRFLYHSESNRTRASSISYAVSYLTYSTT